MHITENDLNFMDSLDDDRTASYPSYCLAVNLSILLIIGHGQSSPTCLPTLGISFWVTEELRPDGRRASKYAAAGCAPPNIRGLINIIVTN